MSSLRKEVRKLVEVARAQGWDVRMTKRHHWRFAPTQGQLVFTGSTPSDQRGLTNLRKDLMRQGLVL